MAMDEAYTWVEDPGMCKIGVAGCITVVTGSRPVEVLAAFGADIEPSAHPWEYAWDRPEPTVAVATVDDAVVAVEDNGFEGSRSEVLRVASRPARAGAVFWNVNGTRRVGLAEGGRVLCMFDPYDPQERWGDDPDVAAPLVAVATQRVTDQDPVGVGMVVVERFTGVVVTPEVINGVETVHVVVPRLEDHWPADPQWHSLRSREAGLVDAIAALPAGDCRRLAAWAAGEAVVSSGLDGIPAIAQSVAALAAAAEPLPSDTEVLLRRINADGYRKRDEGPWLPSSPGVAMVREVGP